MIPKPQRYLIRKHYRTLADSLSECVTDLARTHQAILSSQVATTTHKSHSILDRANVMSPHLFYTYQTSLKLQNRGKG